MLKKLFDFRRRTIYPVEDSHTQLARQRFQIEYDVIRHLTRPFLDKVSSSDSKEVVLYYHHSLRKWSAPMWSCTAI